MKKKWYRFSFSCLFLFLVTQLMACSQTTLPVAISPKRFEQYKIQAVDHWDTLADNVAQRVVKTFEDRPDLIARPIYFVPPASGVFTNTFLSLLRTRLVTRGMQIADLYEPNVVELSFNVQTVRFSPSREEFGASLASLGIGIGSAIAGRYPSISDNEVIINTRIIERNRYVMSLSQVCYINDEDWVLYFDTQQLYDRGSSADEAWKQYAMRGQSFPAGRKSYQEPIQRTYYDTSREQYRKSVPLQTKNNAIIYPASEPIVEEYIMPSGAKRINPLAPPAPLGKKKRKK